ncbi:MAG TPA: glycosyltransferase [Firmicutes bacterium]|nr:glycosyltransferase [Bacillota bacterium]
MANVNGGSAAVALAQAEAQVPTVSACLIVKNEEQFLGGCLGSLRGVVDEIVVVDTGSTDRTVEIAQAAGARVVHERWYNDFAAARNRSLAEAVGDWILIVDADERLQPGQADKLRQLVANPDADGYLVLIVNFPDSEESRVTTHRLSLFRNRPDYRYEGTIHEQIAPAILKAGGRILACDLKLDHYGYDPRVRILKGKEARNVSMVLKELRKDPGNAFMRYNLAQEYHASGRLEEAVAQFRRCLWLAPADKVPYGPKAVYRLVNSLARLGRWEEALRLCDQYEPLLPDYTDLKFLDGVVAFHAGDLWRAQLSFLAAIGKGDAPTDKYDMVHAGAGSYKAWWYLGQTYERGGQDQKAAAAYTGALQCNPRYVPALRSWLEVALRVDRPEAAYEQLRAIVNVDELPFEAADAAYTAFLNLGAYEEALQVLNWRLWEEPARALARRHRQALVWLARGDAKRAFTELQQALADSQAQGSQSPSSPGARQSDDSGREPDASGIWAARRDAVLAALAAGEYEPARQLVLELRQAGIGQAEQGEGDQAGRGQAAQADVLGHVLTRLMVQSAAGGGATAMDDVDGKTPVDLGGLGPVNSAGPGNVSDLWTFTSAHAPERTNGLWDQAHQDAAWELITRAAFFNLGSIVDQLVNYLADSGVSEPVLRRRLGEIFYGLHREELAMEFLVQAALQGEHTPDSLQMIALYARRKGFLPEAETILRTVVESRPNDPIAILRLAQVLEDQGKTNEAVQVVRDAHRTLPDSAIIKSWLKSHEDAVVV